MSDKVTIKGATYSAVPSVGIERVMHNGRFIGTIEPAGEVWCVRGPRGEALGLPWLNKDFALRHLIRGAASDEITHWELSL